MIKPSLISEDAEDGLSDPWASLFWDPPQEVFRVVFTKLMFVERLNRENSNIVSLPR